MEVSRSLCGKWEKYIGRVNMMLEVISKFCIELIVCKGTKGTSLLGALEASEDLIP